MCEYSVSDYLMVEEDRGRKIRDQHKHCTYQSCVEVVAGDPSGSTIDANKIAELEMSQLSSWLMAPVNSRASCDRRFGAKWPSWLVIRSDTVTLNYISASLKSRIM